MSKHIDFMLNNVLKEFEHPICAKCHQFTENCNCCENCFNLDQPIECDCRDKLKDYEVIE